MKKLILVFVLFSFPATAQEVELSKSTCKYLTRYQPAPDVAYKAGTDVHGRAVAPADLTPPAEIGDSFTIPLSIDLAHKYGLTQTVDNKATIGVVTVDGDKVYLNGQPVGQEDEQNLAVLCLEANGKHR